MSADRPASYLASLVNELRALPRETEWVEFKLNDAEPQAIGEYISALANAAALVGKAFAYLVWGVRNEDHAVAGTTFDPRTVKVGNEELESWLLRLLEPRIDFRLFSADVDGYPDEVPALVGSGATVGGGRTMTSGSSFAGHLLTRAGVPGALAITAFISMRYAGSPVCRPFARLMPGGTCIMSAPGATSSQFI